MGLREGGRENGMRAGKEVGILLCLAEFVFDFWHSSSTFLKVQKICNQLICNMTQYGNLHISSPGKTPGVYAALRVGFSGFEHMFLIFF